jgi:hypothetical protein
MATTTKGRSNELLKYILGMLNIITNFNFNSRILVKQLRQNQHKKLKMRRKLHCPMQPNQNKKHLHHIHWVEQNLWIIIKWHQQWWAKEYINRRMKNGKKNTILMNELLIQVRCFHSD